MSNRTTQLALVVAVASTAASALVFAACGDSNGNGSTQGGGAGSTTANGGGTTGSGGKHHAGGGGSTSTTADGGSGGSGGKDAGPIDPCGDALFCEKFDDYAAVTAITNNQKFGPWHAALNDGATMQLDSTHVTSGSTALHVHIDQTKTAGGRLFSDGDQPIFMTKPTHVYGRMMMYIDPNGTSIHWTFFGVSGDAQAPANGRNAQYILSSLPRSNVNTYSFVYGLAGQGSDGYHDCSSQSMTPMPTAAWSCVSWELDSVARKLRMYKDGATTPILSVDDHGNGCVAPTDKNSPWYGPSVAQLFVGAWSFHPMNAPLDVWIDDVVVDTKPVACPAP